MKRVAVGVHLRKEDIEPLAEAVPAAGLWLSAVPLADDQPLGDRDLLLRVAGVRAALLERATFIAIRYGFAFHSPEEAEAKCAGQGSRWRALLEENHTRVELALKVTAEAQGARPDRHDFSSGADYLRALHGARDEAKVGDAFREAVERHIVPICVRHRWIRRDERSIELAALIERERLDELASAGQALKRAVPGVPFLLSAPWPLEIFADADHE